MGGRESVSVGVVGGAVGQRAVSQQLVGVVRWQLTKLLPPLLQCQMAQQLAWSQ